MKNLFLIVVGVLVMASCSNKYGMERKAKKQLNAYIEEFARNPKTYQVTQMNTVYCNDSVCILQYVGKGENGFGGFNSTHYEYVLVSFHTNDGKLQYGESLTNLDDDKGPFSQSISEVWNKNAGTTEKTKDDFYYWAAFTKCLVKGRNISNLNKIKF